MISFPTVHVRELTRRCGLDQALDDWSGAVELYRADVSRPGPPWLELADRADAVWAWTDGVPQLSLQPVGCSFLRDVAVMGSGYLFSQGRFIREAAHTSDVAMQWLARADFPDNPFTRPPSRTLVFDENMLVVFGPGCAIFGHWLLDFMPRVVIATQLLGALIGSFHLLLPDDAPDWVVDMLDTFCGWDRTRIRRYGRLTDQVVCRKLCLPSFAHDGDYALHPLVRDFYDSFGGIGTLPDRKRICLSRRNQERHTRSAWRIFKARDRFERLAEDAGFAIVRPEELDFEGQIQLFRSASHIIGEHGSGMHGAVLADPGTIVGTVGASNAIQFRIGAAFDHKTVCMRRLAVIENAPDKPCRFTATEEDLAAFIRLSLDQ